MDSVLKKTSKKGAQMIPQRPSDYHDDVIKWKHFPRYWPFVRGIHRSPVNFPHKGQWRIVLMFSLNCAWIYGWVNNGEAGDMRRHRSHYDVFVMIAAIEHVTMAAITWTAFVAPYIKSSSYQVIKAGDQNFSTTLNQIRSYIFVFLHWLKNCVCASSRYNSVPEIMSNVSNFLWLLRSGVG